jgi:hypothetical protein
MIVVNSMAELKGKLLRDGAVEILEVPRFDEKLGRWYALANAWGCLAFIELSVRSVPVTAASDTPAPGP